MAVHGFFLLLLVGNSMALWDSNFGIRSWKNSDRGRAVPTRCTQAGFFCSNCQESYFCQTPTSTPFVIPCNPGTVCGGVGCINFLGATSAGDCDCDTVDNIGFLADPYDATRYFQCIPDGGQFLQTCNDGEVFSAEEKDCLVTDGSDVVQTDSDVDCTAENVPGFYTIDPTCKTYTICYIEDLPGILGICSDGMAFDPSVPGCVDQCLLAPSAFACQTGDTGAFPDTSDCTIFHVCNGGSLFASGVPCPDGELFNPTTMKCEPYSTSIVCPVINSCWAAYCDECPGTCPTSITNPNTGGDPSPTNIINPNTGGDPSQTNSPDIITTTPPTGSNGTPDCTTGLGPFEYATDCKEFWSCQDNGAGGFEAILYRCPGPLVYIPSLGYCSNQSNLAAAPGCITS